MTSRLSALTLVALLSASTLALAPGVLPAVAAAPSQRWAVPISGGAITWSSPVLANLDGSGTNDVLVGGENGKLYAFNPAGAAVPGWPATAPGPIDSSPAVGDLDGNGGHEVVVGTGTPTNNTQGGITVFNADGSRRCDFHTQNDPTRSTGVFNAPAIGDVTGDGINDIVFGSFDHNIYVVDGHCNQLASYNNADTVWSAPALYATNHGAQADIFIGGDATQNIPGSHNGGTYRSLSYQAGTLVERWERASAETFQGGSSVADLEGTGRLAVVTGSGADFCRNHGVCTDSNKVWAFHLDDGSNVPGWPKQANFNTTFLSAPAVADVDGDGKPDVVIGATQYTNGNPAGGEVDAWLSGSGFARTVKNVDPFENESSPVVGDVGAGSPQIVVDGTILDRTLTHVGSVNGNNHTSAAIGRFGAGYGMVAVNENGANDTLTAYTISTPSSLGWPQFQQNAGRTGTADATLGIVPIHCDVGYRLVATDGGIFSFFAPFFGSMGGLHLNNPIVGMADAPSQTGYWLVASDGGVFAFGPGARSFGSMGGTHLNAPVVGMAATPDGRGYWLVASDGGIFAFGDAKALGSMGGHHLNAPVVGMASTADGNGYWLVASDGGIFNFGDAPNLGSMGGTHLNQPVVGMAASPAGNGYWLVATDGGIFSFGASAPFLGSTGSIRLNQPIVGMVPTVTGHGYWFDAADGGIFAFPDAQFCGSMGGHHLNAPVVGMG